VSSVTGSGDDRRDREADADEYVLTDAGEALTPVLRSLRVWGERFATPRLAG
jgi:DNA-binding HxlR family transcriptional regulator